MQTTESANGMTRPAGYDETPLPRRNGPKGLLPSTWLNRSLRVDYIDASGLAVTASGTLLDWFPLGLVLNVEGSRTLVSWERVCVVDLVND